MIEITEKGETHNRCTGYGCRLAYRETVQEKLAVSGTRLDYRPHVQEAESVSGYTKGVRRIDDDVAE